MHPDYTIRILEFAVIPQQTAEAAYSGYVFQGETRCFPFTFVLVQGEGRNVLVDCGIDFTADTKRQMADGFALENCHSPGDVLASVGLGVDDIDVIIPTHGHWDHMGSLDLFPNAQIYIQREEYDGWRTLLDRSDAYAVLVSAVDRDDLTALERAERDGRLTVLDDEVRDLLPGIHVWVERNGHSHASQLVLIESGEPGASDDYIVVGDVAYTLDNLTGVPQFPHFIPNTKWAIGGPYVTMQMYERILDYVGDDLHRIIIEHDAETWDRYPTVVLPNGLHVAEVRLAAGATSLAAA